MPINEMLLASQIRQFEFLDFVRIIPTLHASTPLGCNPGISRFGGATKTFAVLYAASDLATALAETLVRDRFEGLAQRRMFTAELVDCSAVLVRAAGPLRLVDLREGGCLKLGISTDISGAKHFDDARSFSDDIYDEVEIDGILYPSRLTARSCVAVFDRSIGTRLQADNCVPLARLSGVAEALSELRIELLA